MTIPEHLYPHPTSANPTGIVSYSIPPALTRLPEWRHFVENLNLCALASGDERLSQQRWLRSIANTAAGISFMDRCDRCAETGRTLQLEAPIEVDASSALRQITASYRCPRGHEWISQWLKRTGVKQ